MALTLKENLNSSYFGAANRMASKKKKRKIIAYVESYDDISFWRALFNEFENEKRYFQIMLPSSDSLAKGKKKVLMNQLGSSELGDNMIACVDSDYDYLLQDTTHTSRKINRNKYVFQTYAYAIENHQCYAESLHEVCVMATLNDRHILNFPEYLKRYSQIAYPLFLWSVYFHRKHTLSAFSITDFCSYARPGTIHLKDPYRSLQEMKRRVEHKLSELHRKYPQAKSNIEQLANELSILGLTPENTYLFIQGHHVMDNVVLRLLTPVCTVLRRERETEIKDLASHNEQFRNELTCYQHSQCNVEIMLRKNTNYKESFLYKQLRKDVENFLNHLK